MKLNLHLVFIFLLQTIFVFPQNKPAAGSYNCFSILAGKNTTIDGSVMLAHNEDDGGEVVVNFFKVPKRTKLKLTDSIVLRRGHKIPQTWETNAYIWFEIPGLEYSDSYMNEYGVTIASNACKSREDKPELVDGGIGYWLRRLMIERAQTAREAVELAGMLIEEIGYADSGRTYSIADKNEAWMLSVVRGKHWIAARIPDHEVAIIPNYYTITEIDLKDKRNFLGSGDIVSYAEKRGWYHPETDGAFNFRKAYSDPENLKNLDNKARHWAAINALSKTRYNIDDNFPFSFVPKTKIGLKDLFHVLRNHYEKTFLDLTHGDNMQNPHHQKAMSICSNTNQYGFVAQLRSWFPTPFANVLWLAPRRPCTESFVPLYCGLQSFPDDFASTDYREALQKHFDKIDDFKAYIAHNNFRFFAKKARITDEDKDVKSRTLRSNKKLEKELLSKQEGFELQLLDLYEEDKEAAKKELTKYTIKQLKRILKTAK